MLNDRDKQQIQQKNSTAEQVLSQISQLTNGFPYIKLHAPATPENGIVVFDKQSIEGLCEQFDAGSLPPKLLKFVPASGAATRMFKSLYEFLDIADQDIPKYLSDNSFASVSSFLKHIKEFAFFPSLANIIKELYQIEIDELLAQKDYKKIIDALLSEKGLGYGAKPKGQLLFHAYPDETRTAFEEHLVEGALHCVSENNEVHIHFTISPEHISDFEKLMEKAVPEYEQRFGIKYSISHSIQKPSTDTIAVDMQNIPFREKDGSLHFRPGGHGALIENLNDIDADIVVIKNIDNLAADRHKAETIRYKKALCAYLYELLKVINHYRGKLSDPCSLEPDTLDDIVDFAKSYLNISIADNFETLDHLEKTIILFEKFNRPFRVCGMVKNQGEPGGGPFWVTDKNGETSLQIVESSQVNVGSQQQKAIFEASTHFNPVDLICSFKDHNGKAYNLKDYTDPETGFISKKSKDGRDLKALELPGLWNGAMANWITVFVEVPLITFNPVKTVNDLLRTEHKA